MLLGFHLREAAAGQEQLGISHHWWVQWSTLTFSSFTFCCSFTGWSNRELFRTVPSLSFFLPWVSLGHRTCWGCNQLPGAVWADEGWRGAGFVTIFYQNCCKISGTGVDRGDISFSPRFRRDNYQVREFTILQWWLATDFKPMLRYERSAALLLIDEVNILSHI